MSNKQRIAFITSTVVLVVGIFFCGVSWRLTKEDLDLARAELDEAYATLGSDDGELSEVRDELLTIKAELRSTQNYLSDVEAELEDTRARLCAIEADAFHLHNPTLGEVVSFLEEDKTDSNEYVEDEYVCSHFAGEVNNNADSQGIRCALVDIRFSDSAHAIIAFDARDEGMVYFDPVTDERVRPVVGKEYWRCIEPKPGYRYKKPSFDDTIVDIVVIW